MFDNRLAEYNHFGTVTLAVDLNKDGEVKAFSWANSEDKILQVHAARAIRKALKQSFKQVKWLQSSEQIQMLLRFDFLNSDANLNLRKQSSFAKPILKFTRTNSTKPIHVSDNFTKEEILKKFVPKAEIREGDGNQPGSLFLSIARLNPFELADRRKKYNGKRLMKAGHLDPFESYKSDPAYLL